MYVLGVDLSGPANHRDTAAALFKMEGEELKLITLQNGLSDADLLSLAMKTEGAVLAAGLDAPLSYNDGGGDRPSDRWFRKEMIKSGLHPGSIMTPTLTKMVYLTVRGIALASMLERTVPGIQIAEVHPGSALLKRVPEEEKGHVLLYKKEPESGSYLIEWFRTQRITGIPDRELSSHETDAIAAGMAVRDWILGRPKVLFPKQPPHHPYDLIC
ncbi:DUF429 domain-containing protein [Bacillus mangrovi]|uniref:DUF429 domain-containing protein n=1 Tax=Metabacillus mangrovi TaxID=1491830 RepID=A0A7X2S5H4_9BACI|nr:DUF429 domain-containing protein [Metabacillus mangrovi]MTH53576.1 DUF429 domain-containing protein [Metabacillus mangrovi]